MPINFKSGLKNNITGINVSLLRTTTIRLSQLHSIPVISPVRRHSRTH